MEILLFGDVHAEFQKMLMQVKDAKNRGYEPEAIIQVGDFGIFHHTIHRIPEPNVPFYFILGNHEEAEAEYLSTKLPKNYHLLSPKKAIDIGGLNTVGVGRSGFLDYINTPPGSVIRPEDVSAACEHDDVDLVLTHDCPKNIGMRSNFMGPWMDVGAPALNALFTLHPNLWLFGHHHMNFIANVNRTQLVGLCEAIDGYAILNTQNLSIRFVHNHL